MANLRSQGRSTRDQLATRHRKDMDDLRLYLEQRYSLSFKPSPELLNLRRIESHLSKQKNYTEAKRVQKCVRDMEIQEQDAYMKQREDKIRTQLHHMKGKQELEMNVLVKKIETNIDENDKMRKKEQERLL